MAPDVHAAFGRKGVTLFEIVIALSVLTILLVSLGAALGTFGRQTEMNRQLAIATSEAGNALSLIHTAPFDAIGQDVAQHGFVSIGNFAYRKDLAGAPSNLPDGQISMTLLGVTVDPADGAVKLPDPLTMNVTVSWTMAGGATASRTFATVRTR